MDSSSIVCLILKFVFSFAHKKDINCFDSLGWIYPRSLKDCVSSHLYFTGENNKLNLA